MKTKKHKSKHKYVIAIINNSLQMFPVLHEETWTPTAIDGDMAEESRYFVCAKTKVGPRIYFPISMVLFIEDSKIY